MNIQAVIRSARRERGFTQEAVAERLNISVSAVSQWESGRTLPDLALIAPLCNLLEISADTLFGIDLERRAEHVKAIDDEAHKFLMRGYLDDAESILRDGLRELPGEHTLSCTLMHVLINRVYHGASDEAQRELLAEIIRIGENLLADSTDSQLRSSVIQILIFAYDLSGEDEKAKKLAESQPTLVLSREFLLAHIAKGDDRIESERSLISNLLGQLADRFLWFPSFKRADGSELYTRDERFLLREKQIALYRLMFEDGNYGFGHVRLIDAEYKQALYFVEKGELDSALDRLERAAAHVEGFLEFAALGKSFVHTSLLLRGLHGGSFSTNDSDNDAALMRSRLDDKRFDTIREAERFRAIIARLDERAGKWKINS